MEEPHGDGSCASIKKTHGWQQSGEAKSVKGNAEDTRIRMVFPLFSWSSGKSLEIVLVLHGPDTAMRFPMTLLCQEQCTPAVTVLKDRGENFAFRFLCYVACILTRLRYQGFTLLYLGDKQGNHDGLCCLPTARCSFL